VALVVIYDACVLHPAPLRDFLLRIALTRVVRARWTEEILDECFESVLRQRPDLNAKSLRRTRDLMTAAVPDCMVTGYEGLTAGLRLPDPDDRHVLAAGGPALTAHPGVTRSDVRFVLPAGSPEGAAVHVFDVTGRRVRTLASAAGEAHWDGTGPTGLRAPAGVYFGRTPAAVGAARVVLLR